MAWADAALTDPTENVFKFTVWWGKVFAQGDEGRDCVMVPFCSFQVTWATCLVFFATEGTHEQVVKSVRITGMTENSLDLPPKFVPHWKLLAAGMNIKITHLRQPETYLRQ